LDEAGCLFRCSLTDSAPRVTVDHMELIEAEFNEGVLRPMRRLRLRPGERVGIVVVRRPDALRWDLGRLAKVIRDEETLTEAGLAECEQRSVARIKPEA